MKVVIRFAGKLWLEREKTTTVWRIGSFGNTLWRDDERYNLAFLSRRHENGLIGSALRASPLDLLFLHKTTIAKASAWPFGSRHLPLSPPLHENTTQMWARPCGPRLWSVANAPGANFSPPQRPPRGLGHAALTLTMLSVCWTFLYTISVPVDILPCRWIVYYQMLYCSYLALTHVII